MKKISLEYAHIYTNQSIFIEKELYEKQLQLFFESFSREETSIVIMVDDYSFPDPHFKYDDFINHITEKFCTIDVLIRESELIKYCDLLLKEITTMSLQNEISQWIIKHKKYPCSLFIASWYLIRLGEINSSLIPDNQTAKFLHNILPVSFKPFEEKAFEIISSTKWNDANAKITNIYLDGRDII